MLLKYLFFIFPPFVSSSHNITLSAFYKVQQQIDFRSRQTYFLQCNTLLKAFTAVSVNFFALSKSTLSKGSWKSRLFDEAKRLAAMFNF